MDLGAFSISLAVSDIPRSLEFYERLGFVATGGDADGGWLILRNDHNRSDHKRVGHTTIGLFAGMFERNMLTFNPGLDGPSMLFVDEFTDVRDIQASLEADGIELGERADPESTGAAHITAVDPDGNPILIDQFDRPEGMTGLAPPEFPEPPMPLELGAFTYNLEVADLERSAGYYGAFGFTEFASGDDGGRWIATRNGGAVLSLHEAAIGGNSLTFNPGLDEDSRQPSNEPFTTLAEITTVLIDRGLAPDRSVDPTGHRAVAFVDPDGYRVLIHQLG
jgi:catechol 2,3-dioxygenase-like lactoylglutathione lyase family enzyme